MKTIRSLILVLFVIIASVTHAQKYVRGVVLEETKKGQFVPLVGAPVIWLGTNEGTVTDTSGAFKIQVPLSIGEGLGVGQLVISYIGFKSDTIDVKGTSQARVILAQEGSKELNEVEITERISSSSINALEPLNTKNMSEKELFKAACCNLSESFETNPSVDVSYPDAATGAKQIQMLGLSGIYTQMTTENMPGIRGLAANYGMSYIPGPWIESIQVTKGVGSVVNGYESMTGQINVELKKTEVTPKVGERVYANAYVNMMGRTEGNLNITNKLSKKWSTTTLLHANGINNRVDMNDDKFLDIPLGYQFNGVNRWKFEHNNWIVQFGVKALVDERTGGQYEQTNLSNSGIRVAPNENIEGLKAPLYNVNLNTQRLEGFSKLGYVFPEKKYKSIGLIINQLFHVQSNNFGLFPYDGFQNSSYANLIYQSIIGNTNHKFRTGLSLVRDELSESYPIPESAFKFKRTEIVPGAFFEYTWQISQRITIIPSLRADYNNLFGAYITPRLHGKIDITEKTSIRFSGGRGQRTPTVFSDNMNYLVSNRSIIINNKFYLSSKDIAFSNGEYFGGINYNDFTQNITYFNLKPEVSWNYGASLSQDFKLDYRKGNITVDYYRTDFVNQVVVDLDQSPQQLNIYNLNGQSYANSFQAEVDYELLKRLDIRLAYRMYDVKTTYHGELLERPFISKHRAFANIAYETKSKWKFDYTINWNGPKRLPNTSSNPTEYQRPSYSPDFFLMNAQISKSFGNPMKTWWDVYLGCENLLDFRQQDLIIAANAPYSQYFDASLVWGPIIGRMFYAGARFKLK
ncbi:MAG: carboxypeptidase-like regulatory domain-containing protein [Bacteroidota bacterium]|nr:carboxypeptidase-like regulatory domain-containing protein [Bacteroidota bacterium]